MKLSFPSRLVTTLFSLMLTGPLLAAPPANDAFANRITLSGTGTLNTAGSNVEATKEAGEPFHWGSTGGKSVWWSWTAPSSGVCVMNTFGSNFDTLLAVYTGSSVNALSLIASNDDTSGAQSWVSLSVSAGTTYQIAVDGYSSSTGSISLTVEQPVPPPANDSFATRDTLSGAPTSMAGTNVGATVEAGEPSHAGYSPNATVWWTWTAPATGECPFQVTNASFTSVMGIYTGTALNGLTQVGSAYSTNIASVPVVAGTSYQIAVGGFSSGTFTLNVGSIMPPPPNDLFADRLALPSSITLISGTSQGATKEAGEPDHGGSPGGRSVWYSWTAPSTGELTLQVTNNSFGPLVGVYTGSSLNSLTTVAGGSLTNILSFQVVAATTYQIAIDGTNSGAFTLNFGAVIPPPVNDLFASRISVGTGPALIQGTNQGASREPWETVVFDPWGMPIGKTVWWSFTPAVSGECAIQIYNAAFIPYVQVFTGSGPGSLVQAAPNGFGGSVVTVSAGVTYHLAVDSYSLGGGSSGTFALQINDPLPPPSNDSFANRVVLSGMSARANGYNNAATKEAGEPSHASDTGGKSVWYSWTAPDTGSYTLYLYTGVTTGTPFINSLVGIYTGTSVGDLTSVASTSGQNVTSLTLPLSAVAGTTYQIAIDGSSTSTFGNSGSFLLNVTQPPLNNAFTNRIDLGSTNSASSASWVDLGTTTEFQEPAAGAPLLRTLWWSWTAPTSGFYAISTLDSDFDNVLQVFTGPELGSLTYLMQNEAADDQGRARLALNATAGTTYHFRVGGQTGNDIGNVTLQINPLAAPSTASDHVLIGRAWLQAQNVAALANADASFEAALAIDSNHPEANLLRAISLFARLEQGSAFQSALTGLGLVDGDLYSGGHTLPKDLNGNRIATPGTHTSHGLTFLVNTVLPELPLIRAHLDKATLPGFQTRLTETESTYHYSIIDQGDISLIKASTYLTEAMIRFLQTFDAGASMADLITQSNGADLTAKGVSDSFSNLLGNTGNNQRTAFKVAMQNANTHYQAGSSFIRTSRPDPADDKYLFFLPANAAATEAEARVRAQEASAALDGPATLAGEYVDLSSAIASPQSLRERIPGLVGNKAVASTTPDPTFGGAAPNMTQTQLNGRLRKLGILHEVSSFGNWTQHYLSSLPPGSQDKNDDPDGDMLSNFAEFAFHLDPAKGSSSSEFAVGGLETNVVDNKPYLNIIFRRRIIRDMVNYIVAVSDDLVSWDRTQAQVVQVGAAVPNADGITETVKFRVVADPDITIRKFVRVEAVDLAP